MKPATKAKVAKGESLEERFQRFAKALMAVPKHEIDKETDKAEREKKSKPSKRQS